MLMSGLLTTRARAEQRRKEKKEETEAPLGEVLVHPEGRVEGWRRRRSGPAPRPDQIISPERLPTDIGCLSPSTCKVHFPMLAPGRC